MAKDKQKKKKEREKRVAQKKLAEAAKRREREQEAAANSKSTDKAKRVITPVASVPKTKPVTTNTKSPFTHRRTGGG